MTDIAPELYDKIKKSFDDNTKSDKKLNSLLKKLENGKATQEDICTYADRIGSASSKALLEHMTADNLPDGRIYWNIAERTIKPALKTNYDKVNDYAVQALKALDKTENIGLKAVEGEYPDERIKAIEDAACMPDKSLEEARKALGEPVRNTTRAFVDDFVKSNSEFRYKAGLSPKIIRTDSYGCCKWCSNLAGVYDYEAVRNGSDVFRRHDNCRCTVTFQNGSSRQNVHTKKWDDEASNIKPKSETLKQREFDASRRIATARGEPYDATEEWLYKAKDKKGNYSVADKAIYNGVIYKVDGVNVLSDPKQYEIDIAKSFADNYGKKVTHLPRIINPTDIQCADLDIDGEIWDIKRTEGTSKHNIYGMIKGHKGQAENFIIDASIAKLKIEDIEEQVINDVMKSKHTDFAKKIIIIKDNKVIKVLER